MIDDDLARLGPLAAAQAGVFHIEQAVDLGVPRRAVRASTTTGALVAVHRNVLRVATTPESDQQRIWASVLQVGGGRLDLHAVASHESVFRAHGITHVPYEPAVTVPAGAAHRFDGIRVHRMCDLHADMVEHRDGLPMTTIARAVIDVASVFRLDRLDHLVDHLTITERVTTLGSIERALRRSNRRGRRRIAVLQDLLDARGETMPRSLSERRADEILATTGLPRPVAEYPHPGWALGPAFVDRAWPEALLIVEIDGRSWHQRDRDMQKDRARDRSAGSAGWFTARFLHSEVRDEPEAFLADVVGIHSQRLAQLVGTGANLGQGDR